MKKIAIFGSGEIGKRVLDILGNDIVSFFVSNYPEESICAGMPLISFEEYLERSNEVYAMVASTKYAEELCAQLEDNGITDYFVWDEMFLSLFSDENMNRLPRYNPVYTGSDWSSCPYPLVRAFFMYDISKYKNIGIYVYDETSKLLVQLMKLIGKSSNVIALIHQGELEKQILESNLRKMDCIICAVRRDDNYICDIYEHVKGLDVVDFYDLAYFLPETHSKKAIKYKNKYKGKRCFVIGNGPSLRKEDLDKLEKNGEITFACNKIHNIFPETCWRPDFYFLIDVWVLKSQTKELLNIEPKECCFYNYAFCNGYILWNNKDNIIPLYHMPEQDGIDRLTRFSKDISVQHCLGSSVTYAMLQAAYYMGFESVYLIGCDHFVESLKKMKEIKHFYENSNEVVWDLTPEYLKLDNHLKLDNAYKAAKLAFEEDGRNIYNATRGGYLDIFKRVDFDALFPEEQ